MIHVGKCSNPNCNHWQIIRTLDITNYSFKCNLCGKRDKAIKIVKGLNTMNIELKAFDSQFKALDFCMSENGKDSKPFTDANKI